ncbi:acyltransferase family protein [Lacticaseibacillus sp. GG6-2]
MSEKKRYNESFELVKTILALMVIGIHTIYWDKIPILSLLVYPILRIAVPIFFMFSAYFFFSNINRRSKQDAPRVLKRSVIRYLKLYSVWYVLLLPASILMRNYFRLSILTALARLVEDYFIGAAFLASWYIGALIVGVPIVYFVSRFVNNYVLILCALVVYAWCVILSNYGNTELGQILNQSLTKIPFYFVPYMNFPISLIWLAMGKWFADEQFRVNSWKRWLVGLVVSGLLLYVEQGFVVSKKLSIGNDAYFMLIPFCSVLFLGILSVNFHVPHARFLRAFSTIGYCFHDSFQSTIRRLLAHFGHAVTRFSGSLMLWLVAVVVCMILTWVILRFEKVHGLKWLKYTH